MRRSVIVVVTAAVAVLLAVSPVMADSALGAKVKCRYTTTQEDNNGWLVANLSRIDVKPPTMYSLSGTQRVGWRFSIDRHIGGAWEGVATYGSPWQRATATQARPAPFTMRGVNVRLPAGTDPTTVRYWVVLERAWYNADGTKEAYGQGGIGEYRYFVDGTLESKAWGYPGCGGQMKR